MVIRSENKCTSNCLNQSADTDQVQIWSAIERAKDWSPTLIEFLDDLLQLQFVNTSILQVWQLDCSADKAKPDP